MKLEELKKLCDEATPGKWEWGGNTYGEYLRCNGEIILGIDAGTGIYTKLPKEDEAFIVAARDALPKLIAVAEAVQAYMEPSDPVVSIQRWEAMRDTFAALESSDE